MSEDSSPSSHNVSEHESPIRLRKFAIPPTSSRHRPLAPKGAWRPLAPHALQRIKDFRANTESVTKRSCNVVSCRLPNCSLPTHSQYRSKKTSPLLSKPVMYNATNELRTEDIEEKLPALITGAIAHLPAMPLQSLENPVFRNLLHIFYSTLFDKVQVLLNPPALMESEKARLVVEKETMFAEAMSSPVYCLAFIATTHHYLGLRRDHSKYHREASLINSELMRLLREKLGNFQPSEVDQLIIAILTMAMFHVAQGNRSSLEAHKTAMVSLVNVRGGLVNMGRTIPYVFNLDRVIAVHTGQNPTYPSVSDQAVQIQRAARHPKVYGSFFDDDVDDRASKTDSNVLEFGREVCRGVEILEGEDWWFDPKDLRDSSEIYYFYFLRDKLNDRFAHLNAQYFGKDTRDRCILLATKIVGYISAMNNYVVAFPVIMAETLQEAISGQNIETVWAGWEDIFRSILFITISMPNPWGGRPWAMKLVKEQLDKLYRGDPWPFSWSDRELANVKRFAWSDTRLKHHFEERCKELGEDQVSAAESLG